MKIDELIVESLEWWLPSVDEHDFRDMFAGTSVMDSIELFRVPPKSDADYFANYLPYRVFRMLSGRAVTRDFVETVALNTQLEEGKITPLEFAGYLRLIGVHDNKKANDE